MAQNDGVIDPRLTEDIWESKAMPVIIGVPDPANPGKSLPVSGTNPLQVLMVNPSTLTGQGTILGPPVSLPIDGTSRSLTGLPAGTGYVLMQIIGSGISARYDAAPATGAAGEIKYEADGFLELTSAAEIAAFRYIRNGSGTGNLNIIPRSN